MKSAAIALFFLALTFTVNAADIVVPVDSVKKHVNVRMEADAKSEIVGKLSQGESLPFQGSVPGWHEVRLEGEAYGYISEDWAQVISEEEFAARQTETTSDAVEADAKIAGEGLAQDSVEAEQLVAATDDTEAKAEAVIVETAEDTAAIAAAEVTPDEEASDQVAEDESAAEDVAVEQVASDDVSASSAEIETEALTDQETEAIEDVADAEDTRDAEDLTVESAPVVAVVPVVTSPGADGPAGPIGPMGPPGAAGATGSSTIDGTEDFLMKFTKSTEGGNSQIFDNGRNVGIGTTEPAQRLEVNGNIQIHEQNSSVAGLMLTQSSGGTGYIMHNRADTLTLGAGSVDRITIDRDGNVGIGTARPSHPLEMASGAYVSAGGVWTNSSSRERKDNIVALTPEEAVAALVALEPVRFNYKRDETEEYVGFIAEDVPGLVASSDRSSLSTMDIVAVLTKVVQQQQQKIASLEARLDSQTQE